MLSELSCSAFVGAGYQYSPACLENSTFSPGEAIGTPLFDHYFTTRTHPSPTKIDAKASKRIQGNISSLGKSGHQR
jgi:hypothetical protein